MTIEVPCRRCGVTFTPSPESIRVGAWRTCPACTANHSTAKAKPRDGPPGDAGRYSGQAGSGGDADRRRPS